MTSPHRIVDRLRSEALHREQHSDTHTQRRTRTAEQTLSRYAMQDEFLETSYRLPDSILVQSTSLFGADGLFAMIE